MDLDREGLGRAALNLGRSRGQENVIIVDTDKDSSSSTFFSQTLAFMEHNKITEGFFSYAPATTNAFFQTL